jgi:iron complex transport system ATP-binding protein
MRQSDSLISADDLAVGYRDPIMEHISFEVRGGEIMTLIGPNGSGKSTILKTLAGYLRKHGGAVYIENSPAESLSPNEKARRLSVVLTERLRESMMTCREVVETGRYPYTGHFGLLSEADRAAVAEAVALVQMEEFADRDFVTVSDGQRQRVMLARAICQEPKILILDEPTSYLDIHHKIVFLEILKKLAAEKNIAVIVSMHELDFAEKIADYAVCVKDGAVFRCGVPQEIFRGEVMRELFDVSEALYEKYLS